MSHYTEDFISKVMVLIDHEKRIENISTSTIFPYYMSLNVFSEYK